MPSRRVTSFLCCVVVAAALLASCSSDDDDGASPASTAPSSSTSSSSSSVVTSPSSSVAPTTSSVAGATTSTTAASKSPVTLAPDGFAIGSRRYTYSGDVGAATLKDAFRPHLGTPLKEADLQCDAGELHQVRWKSIDVYFFEGDLAGWGLNPPRATPPMVTAAGIGLGSTRPEIEKAYPGAQVDETSLGTEWFAPGPSPGTGFSGIFASTAPDAVNEALWSGRTCVAR